MGRESGARRHYVACVRGNSCRGKFGFKK